MPIHSHEERMPAEGYSGWAEKTAWSDGTGYGIAFNYGSDVYKNGATSLKTAGVGSYQTFTESAGHGEAHENMPPYVTKYIWQRIS